MENNINKVGADGYSRISLFHGNVLQPFEAKLVRFEVQELISNIKLREHKVNSEINALESTVQAGSSDSTGDKYLKRNFSLPARDIVCAFNYSCCCLHKRADLVLYFKHVLDALSKKGGIFVMDLYGGTSSERKLRLQRRFPNFTVYYICSKYHGKIIAYMGGPQVYIGMHHFPFRARFMFREHKIQEHQIFENLMLVTSLFNLKMTAAQMNIELEMISCCNYKYAIILLILNIQIGMLLISNAFLILMAA